MFLLDLVGYTKPLLVSHQIAHLSTGFGADCCSPKAHARVSFICHGYFFVEIWLHYDIL